MSDGKIRVLVTDDHPVVLFGLAAIISAQPDMVVVARAANGHEAVELFREHRPDVALMDLRLPGMSGVEAIRVIRQEHPDSRFIVLTTYEGDENIHRAVQAGAQAYLLKGMPHAELVKAIRAVHRGLRYLPAPVRESLEGRPHGPVLSEREMEILRLIVRGLSNKEIGTVLHITEGTVKWHVNIILSRLNVTDRTQAVVAAVRRGLVHL